MSNAKTIEAIVRQINGGCFAKIDYKVPAADIRKGATDGSGATNPLWSQKDAIRKVVTSASVNLGVVYGNAINGRLEKKELPADFVPQEMRGKVEHDQKHKNLCQSTDHSKTYMRYMAMPSKAITVRYELGDMDVTDVLKPFKAVKKVVATQADAGLNDGEQLIWRTINIDNITRMSVLGMTLDLINE